MSICTYNLKEKNINSNEYYEKIKIVSNKVKTLILTYAKSYIEEFMLYIQENNIEDLRTKDEYAIEVLMIGVMLSEYSKYSKRINKATIYIFKFLNTLREKTKMKKEADLIRGYLISGILMKKSTQSYEYDINKLILWMESTGEFREEVIRLNSWKKFLLNKNKEYSNLFFGQCLNLAHSMYNICEDIIGIYLKELDLFLKKVPEKYKHREDLVYCSKGKIQYYFNMVSSKIMNDVYSKRFLKCETKKIFAPGCMRQLKNECRATKNEYGLKCVKCSINCNIHVLTNLMENRDIDVCIIPHETIINKLNVETKNKIGIVGIACITNLMAGGWEALRLGFIPQCVLLDSSGCEKHWLDKGKMTEINLEYLEREILNKKIVR